MPIAPLLFTVSESCRKHFDVKSCNLSNYGKGIRVVIQEVGNSDARVIKTVSLSKRTR